MGNQKKVAANRLPWYAKIAGILVPLVELVIADRLQKAGNLLSGRTMVERTSPHLLVIIRYTQIQLDY